jgi:hypothetical protein
MSSKEDAVLDELRDRVITYLSHQRLCVITTNGPGGAWAVAAQYQNDGLLLKCRVPRWSDCVYNVELDPRTIVIIADERLGQLRWLEYRGIAHAVDSLDERFVALRIAPERVDLIDERHGWGARESLDVYPGINKE